MSGTVPGKGLPELLGHYREGPISGTHLSHLCLGWQFREHPFLKTLVAKQLDNGGGRSSDTLVLDHIRLYKQ